MSEDKKPTSTKKAQRPTRTPLRQQKKLAFAERPGYVRRLVNDIGDRIKRFELAGWTLVENEDANNLSDTDTQKGSSTRSPVKVRVNEGLDARNHFAYLMEIDETFYNEDKQAALDALKKATDDRIDPKNAADYGELKYE